MKTRHWLLLAVGVCFSANAVSVALDERTGIVLPCERDGRRLAASSYIPAILPATSEATEADLARQGVANALPRRKRASALLRALDPQPDDDGQADDASDDSGEANLALSDQCNHPTEWRLVQPDAPGFFSFTNSKTRPPPTTVTHNGIKKVNIPFRLLLSALLFRTVSISPRLSAQGVTFVLPGQIGNGSNSFNLANPPTANRFYHVSNP